MDLSADGVSGAVREELAVTGVDDDLARSVIDLPAADLFVGRNRCCCHLQASIAGFGHNVEYLLMARGGSSADTGPCDVVINGIRVIELRPHIDEHEVAILDGSIVLTRRPIVRIARVRVASHDDGRIGNEAFALE